MNFEMKQISAHQTYNLLIGLVVPRPIALVTSHDLEGQLNAAPFSAYNYLSTDPPLVAIGIASQPGRPIRAKDTARNILDTKEFVVNVVTEDIAEKMNICAIDFPPEVSEIDQAKFTTTPSNLIRVPRINEASAAMECKHVTTLQIGRSHIVIGEVVSMFVKDEFVDTKGPYIRADLMHNVGRANGLGSYVRTRDAFFTMPRIKLEDWTKRS